MSLTQPRERDSHRTRCETFPERRPPASGRRQTARMRSSHFTTPARGRRRLAAAAVAGTLVLAACSGSDDASDTIESADADASQGNAATDTTADASDVGAAASVATGPGFVDLVGPDVVPAAEMESNPLPDVVIDDVTNGRKVNFRNVVPQDKPVLLWMYAPH